MPQIDREDNELASVSEDHPEHGILEDMYILKYSLLENGKLTSKSFSYLLQIENILSEFPELSKALYEWKFLENEILYFLRSEYFEIALRLITKIISLVDKAPALYFTKKYLFFITERLYSAMGGEGRCKDENSFYLSHSQISGTEIPFIEKMENDTSMGSILKIDNDPLDDISAITGVNQLTRQIMLFIKKLIELDKSVIMTLHDILFFELANVCICIETAQMFNSIFTNITFIDYKISTKSLAPWQKDGLYEVRRPYFDPEVFFRDGNIFCPITPVENLKSGIFKQIYDQCTNLKNFADLSLKDITDAMLFKRILYTSEELEVLVLEGKDPKIIKFYRRCLEVGATPEKAYMNVLIKAVDDPKLSRDASIALYYFIDYILDFKLFTEDRIRKIIQNLEYHCEHECILERCSMRDHKYTSVRKDNPPMKQSVQSSFDSNICTDKIFGETCADGLFNTPKAIDSSVKKGILDDFSEFEHENFGDQAVLDNETDFSTHHCAQYRILKLLQHIYPMTNQRFFFKPTYLILLRNALGHVPSLQGFITEIFRDFLEFLALDRMNMTRLFFPVFKRYRRLKMREIRLDEGSDILDLPEMPKEVFEKNDAENRTPNISNGFPPLKVRRGVIESEESEPDSKRMS